MDKLLSHFFFLVWPSIAMRRHIGRNANGAIVNFSAQVDSNTAIETRADTVLVNVNTHELPRPKFMVGEIEGMPCQVDRLAALMHVIEQGRRVESVRKATPENPFRLAYYIKDEKTQESVFRYDREYRMFAESALNQTGYLLPNTRGGQDMVFDSPSRAVIFFMNMLAYEMNPMDFVKKPDLKNTYAWRLIENIIAKAKLEGTQGRRRRMLLGAFRSSKEGCALCKAEFMGGIMPGNLNPSKREGFAKVRCLKDADDDQEQEAS